MSQKQSRKTKPFFSILKKGLFALHYFNSFTYLYCILLAIFTSFSYTYTVTAINYTHAVLYLQHNTYYVVSILTAFFIVFKVSISFYLSVFYVPHLLRLYKFSSYLCLSDREYPRVWRYLYLCYKMFLQTDVLSYAGKPFRVLLPRLCTGFSYRATH